MGSEMCMFNWLGGVTLCALDGAGRVGAQFGCIFTGRRRWQVLTSVGTE